MNPAPWRGPDDCSGQLSTGIAVSGPGEAVRPFAKPLKKIDGAVVPRKMTELTLAFDHRVCDGGIAGGFLRFVADCVESPASALRYL